MTPPIIAKGKRRGQSMIEFTLVGIPILFVLISIFEISRGMWMYHTMSYAVKDGVRYASVHGVNCYKTASNANDCQTSIAKIASLIRFAGVGLDPNTTTLRFYQADGTLTATCILGGAGGTDCPALTGTWPPYDGTGTNDGVGKSIRIDVNTPFHSAISMFWPGSKPMGFGTVNLGASSTDYIQY